MTRHPHIRVNHKPVPIRHDQCIAKEQVIRPTAKTICRLFVALDDVLLPTREDAMDTHI
jgi:hypothetical protein